MTERATEQPGRDRPLQHDSRRPPRWLGRGLVMAVVAVFGALFLWYAFGELAGLGVNVLVALFLALALEPSVLWLVRHGWRRQVAALTTLVGSVLAAVGLLALFGNLFVQQVVELFSALPGLYADVQEWLAETLGVTVPGTDELVRDILDRWGGDVASGVFLVGTTLVSALFAITTVLLVAYYLLAAGPRFRAAICAWLTPDRQGEMLHLWEVTQVKVSDFISSRIVLAMLSSASTLEFLTALGTPYAIPLALFTGIVSQFVPTIGTYIGGALPVVVALSAQGVPQAVAVLVFVVAYQQLENFVLSPKVSAHSLEMNPAVSFLVVLGSGAVFGPIGAFLGLPVAATVQAVGSTYLQRHEIIDSELLHDPGRTRRESPRARRGRGTD